MEKAKETDKETATVADMPRARADWPDIVELYPRGRVRVCQALVPAIQQWLYAVAEQWQCVVEKLNTRSPDSLNKAERNHLEWCHKALAATKVLANSFDDSISVGAWSQAVKSYNEALNIIMDSGVQRMLDSGHVVTYPDRG